MHTPTRPWPAAVRALRHRNFRLYFAGHAISTLGTTVQQVAMAWLAYRLTGATALIGSVTFVTLVPQLLVGPLAGAWIDRHDKRRLLIAVQVLLGLQAALLAGLTASDLIGPSLLIGMAALLGVLNALDTPLRQSLISQFVDDRADLPNALALNATLLTSSRFVGPPLAGLLLAATSEAACFAFNGLTYLALLGGLLSARVAAPPPAKGSLRSIFGEGLQYSLKTPRVHLMMTSVLAVNLTASSYVVLLPVFAGEVFSGGATTLGWLWGAAGLGSLGASLFLASGQNVQRLPLITLGAALASALALIAFAASSNLWLALAAMTVVGFGITASNVGTNIVLQSSAPDGLRGRVVALYISIRFGADAIGGLLAGLIAARLGASPVLTASALVLLAYGVWAFPRALRIVHDESA